MPAAERATVVTINGLLSSILPSSVRSASIPSLSPAIASAEPASHEDAGFAQGRVEGSQQTRSTAAISDTAEISDAARAAHDEQHGTSDAEEAEIRELKQRHDEVVAHEQAHKTAGGAYAGAISYDYQTGPDQKRYAVSGSVPIDTSPISGDPQATIRKMEQVKRAALAPAQPSAADHQVAAKAEREKMAARAELQKYQQAARSGSDSEAAAPNPGAILDVVA